MIEFIASTLIGAFFGGVVWGCVKIAAPNNILAGDIAFLIVVGALCGAAIGGLGYVVG